MSAVNALEHRVPVAPDVALNVEWRRGDPEAAPFVLVHGLASNLHLWDGVAERLHARGHTVVAVDQRGHGRSDAPEGGYNLDTAVADLLALVDALGLARPVLAGQSWGGNVVLELACRRPDASRGVACIDGGIIELVNSFPTWESCLAALTPPSLEHLTMAEFRARLQKSNSSFPAEALVAYEHCFRERPDGTIEPRLARHRHLEILRSLWEHRPSRRFASLSVPAILLIADNGDERRAATKRQAEAAALASGAKVRSHWFSPAHHDLHLQFPDRVTDVLAGAVREGFFA